MRKWTAMAAVGMMALSLVGCAGAVGSTSTSAEVEAATVETTVETERPETITIQSLDGNREATKVEVPYDPERIAILDMPALDIIDSLGLGDRVVGSAKVTIDYLTQYNPEDSEGEIVNLGSVKTAERNPFL